VIWDYAQFPAVEASLDRPHSCSNVCSNLGAACCRSVPVHAGRSRGVVGWPAGLEPVGVAACPASIAPMLPVASMPCPRCGVVIRPDPVWGQSINGMAGDWIAESWSCPSCDRNFVTACMRVYKGGPRTQEGSYERQTVAVIWPRASSRPPLSPDVPEPYAGLYGEAALILTDTPRGSAALSRRCLQQLLRDVAGAPHGNLYDEIEWAIKNAGLPSHASESLHELRTIGNMAAHPNKSTATGDYLEVEPGEAEWTLDTLDALFDHYFIGPARTAARKAALTARLGKTP
jgi:hypothetical protein